jgi:hypothetical protein
VRLLADRVAGVEGQEPAEEDYVPELHVTLRLISKLKDTCILDFFQPSLRD